MKSWSRIFSFPHQEKAFSLLELIIVVSILAILASVFISFIGGDQANENSPTGKAAYSSTKTLMSTISKAIIRFRNDMGYYPGQGRLDPDPEIGTSKISLASLQYIDANNPSDASSSDTLKKNWATHTANLWQLFIKPEDTSNENLWNWNKSQERGWNGPYLVGKLRHNFTDGQSGLSRIMGIADAFDNKSTFLQDGNQWFVDYDSPFETPNSFSGGAPDYESVSKFGEPILFEVLSIFSESDEEIGKSYQLRSLGPNGKREDPGDDIILEIERIDLS